MELNEPSSITVSCSRVTTMLRLIKQLASACGAATILLLTSLLLASGAQATVFYARDQLAELAFPDADEVQALDFFVTEDQRADIEKRAAAPLTTPLLTVYAGKRHGRTLGYAILDTHVVRTLPATFLVVLDGNGRVIATHVMAFHEPLEYLPSQRWLGLLTNKKLENDFRVGRAITAITGSTLSTRAVVGGVRRALAIYEVLLARTG